MAPRTRRIEASVPALEAAGEEEHGHVRAGHQEEEADRAQEHPEGPARGPDDLLLERDELHAPALVGLRMLPGQAPGHRPKVLQALGLGHAGGQPGHRPQVVLVAGQVSGEVPGQPHLHRRPRAWRTRRASPPPRGRAAVPG